MTFEEAAHKCVAITYADDVLSAGIVSAWLDDEKCWYAAITRYPINEDHKIVQAHGYSAISLKHAIEMLMVSWTRQPHKDRQLRFIAKFARITSKQLREAQRKAMK